MGWNVAELQQKFGHLVPFVGRNGFEVLEVDRGYVKMRAPLEGNQNHFGVMYAGVLFSLGELPGGIIYLSTFDTSRFYPLVKEVNIRFTAPTPTDATVEVRISENEAARIEAEAEANGKADFELASEIKDANGVVTAICKGVYQLRRIGG